MPGGGEDVGPHAVLSDGQTLQPFRKALRLYPVSQSSILLLHVHFKNLTWTQEEMRSGIHDNTVWGDEEREAIWASTPGALGAQNAVGAHWGALHSR